MVPWPIQCNVPRILVYVCLLYRLALISEGIDLHLRIVFSHFTRHRQKWHSFPHTWPRPQDQELGPLREIPAFQPFQPRFAGVFLPTPGKGVITPKGGTPHPVSQRTCRWFASFGRWRRFWRACPCMPSHGTEVASVCGVGRTEDEGRVVCWPKGQNKNKLHGWPLTALVDE